MRKLNLAGLRYGRLVVLSLAGVNVTTLWMCRCDCGTEKQIRGPNLTSGHTKSCGCISRERQRSKAVFCGDIVKIFLSRGKIAIVDAADYPLVAEYKWRAHKDKHSPLLWYAVVLSPPKDGVRPSLMMHRVILGTPPNVKTDHRDGDGLNNRRSNLRAATHQQNMANQGPRKNNKSGYKGVVATSKGWQASIGHKSKHIYLGIFPTPEAAAHAYDLKAKELNGDFARLNFPD